MSKVSAVIPIYNLEDKLEQSLRSVAGQTFGDMEIIVIDDASQDGSLRAASQILQNSARPYKIIKHEKNRGASASRNEGLRAAEGEYVIFIDGDDMLEENSISVLCEALEASGGDYAACGYQVLESASGAREEHFLDVADGLDWRGVLIGRILNKIEVSHCATLFRRSFLIDNDLCYADGCVAGEDIEFLIKMLCRRPRGVFIRDCLYIYVQHSGMGSRKGVSDKSGKLRRYEHHTGAHFREAEYILEHTQDKTLAVLAGNLLLPLAYLRQLSVYAMKNDRAAFDKLIKSRDVRKILIRSFKSLPYKPEVFFRSLFALIAPQLYYKKYNHYLDR